MADKKRLLELDDIRGISIIVMVLIHTNAYFPKVPLAYTTTELSQFAVVAFIFCSAYLYFLKDELFTVKSFIAHVWKRVRRLIVPYYVFFAVYAFFIYLSTPKKLTVPYILHNLTLWGGIDFNWLVLLFIELAILMPIISLLHRKYPVAYSLFMVVSFISSLVFLFYTPLPYYRSVMWLPWALVLAYTIHMKDMWKNRWVFAGFTLYFFILFVVSQQFVLVPIHRSLRMYDNKYPPNIYHLAYNFFVLNIVYFLAQKGLFRPLRKFIHFYSLYSYQIFFVHILVIYALTVFMKIKFNWITFFLTTLAVTTVVQLVLNFVTSALRYKGVRRSGYSPAPGR